MNRRLKLKDYLACVARIQALTPDEEAQAGAALADPGAKLARRRLEEAYLPRVVGWVSPYRGMGCSFEELIELGNRALLRGLRRYHFNRQMGLEDYLEEKVRDTVEAALLART